MNPVADHCSVCRFWRSIGKNNRFDEVIGACKRNAPVAMQTIASQPVETSWPGTAEDDWCGQFEPKA